MASVSVHALRHYERLGLIRPDRRANGYRDYPARMRREVVFIAMSRQLGSACRKVCCAWTNAAPAPHALAGPDRCCGARQAFWRRARTATASPSSTGTVCAMLMQASVTDTPCASG